MRCPAPSSSPWSAACLLPPACWCVPLFYRVHLRIAAAAATLLLLPSPFNLSPSAHPASEKAAEHDPVPSSEWVSCMQAFAEPLMRATGCAPELMAPALAYMRVRALAAPAVLLVMISQVPLSPLPLPLPLLYWRR